MLYYGVNYTHWDCKILQVQKTPPSFSLIWKLLLKKRCNLHIIIPFQVLIPSSVNIHARSSPVVCRLWAFELSSFSALPIPTSDSQPWSPLDLLSKPSVMYIFFLNPYSDFSVTYILLRPRFPGLLIISISVRVTLPSSRRDYGSRFLFNLRRPITLLLLLLNEVVELCLQQICWLMLEDN